MKQTIIPVGRKILIKRAEAPTHYAGSEIIIPDSMRKAEFKGLVIAVGSQESEIKPGDFVQYTDYAVTIPMMHDNAEHLLLSAGEVLAIIRTE